MSQDVENEKELSPEELKKRREELTAWYKESAKHAKVQLEYEELLTKIEKARAERLQAQMFQAQAYAAQEKEEGANDEARMEFEQEMAKAQRTLKRDQ
jgi:hypothetical protein